MCFHRKTKRSNLTLEIFNFKKAKALRGEASLLSIKPYLRFKSNSSEIPPQMISWQGMERLTAINSESILQECVEFTPIAVFMMFNGIFLSYWKKCYKKNSLLCQTIFFLFNHFLQLIRQFKRKNRILITSLCCSEE